MVTAPQEQEQVPGMAALDAWHAFGVTTEELYSRNSVGFVRVKEQNEDVHECIVRSVGQVIALHRMDDGSMNFFKRNVEEGHNGTALGLDVAPHQRRIAVCERVSELKGQVAIYNVETMRRLHTLAPPAGAVGSITSCAFSGDGRQVIASFQGAEEKGSHVLIWRLQRLSALQTPALCPYFGHLNRVRFCPSMADYFSTSGGNQLRLWHKAADGTFKSHSLQPAGQDHYFIVDHTWLHGPDQPDMLVALCGGGPSNGGSCTILIFSVQANPSLTPTVSNLLELSQTLELHPQFRAEVVTPWSRGFIVGGGGGKDTPGLVHTYEPSSDGTKSQFAFAKRLVTKAGALAGLAVSDNLDIAACTKIGGRILLLPLASSSGAVDDMAAEHFSPLAPGGHHTGPILGMDSCLTRPLLATVGADCSLRVWNFMRWQCELSQAFSLGDVPSCVAMHPSGHYCAIGLPSRVKIFSIFHHGLQGHKELPMRGAQSLSYSRGGGLLAVATGLSVQIVRAYTGDVVHALIGHASTVTTMTWGQLDGVLVTAAADGIVCWWDVRTGVRMSLCGSSNPYRAIAWGGGADCPEAVESGVVAGGDASGLLRVMTRGNQLALQPQSEEDQSGDGSSVGAFDYDVTISAKKGELNANETVTALAFSHDNHHIFCGTSVGIVRVYEWPFAKNSPVKPVAELIVHQGPITSIRTCVDNNFLFTSGRDGAMFALRFCEVDSNMPRLGPDPRVFGGIHAELVSTDVLLETTAQLDSLRKLLEDVREEAEYVSHRQQVEWEEQARAMKESNDAQLNLKDQRAEELQTHLESVIKDHAEALSRNYTLHVQVLQDVEGQYEHRLAVELDRYDRLHEELESMRQKCEELVESQQDRSEALLREQEQAARRVDRELRVQIERLQEDKKYNDQMYRNVLDQQEEEYEKELQQLMAAAQAELGKERAETSKLHALLQTRKTSEDQQKKRMQEIQEMSVAKDKQYESEREKCEKLEAMMSDLQNDVQVREQALQEKDGVIQELRSNNSTLENFRFVLDHRLNQLIEERGPITEHVSSLESHIKVMYDELVAEFRDKKEVARALQQKDSKLSGLMHEIRSLRGGMRAKERLISGFKRDVSALVNITVPRELEAATTALYKKHVRGETVAAITKSGHHGQGPGIASTTTSGKSRSGMAEDAAAKAAVGLSNQGDQDGDSGSTSDSSYESGHSNFRRRRTGRGGEDALELAQHALEAHRQREFTEKRRGELRGELADHKRDSQRRLAVKRQENTTLLAECNDLRRENIQLKRTLEAMKGSKPNAEVFAPCSSTLSPISMAKEEDDISGDFVQNGGKGSRTFSRHQSSQPQQELLPWPAVAPAKYKKQLPVPRSLGKSATMGELMRGQRLRTGAPLLRSSTQDMLQSGLALGSKASLNSRA